MPTFKNPGKIEFDATIIAGGGGGMFVEFPHDVENTFGVKGRVPVKASFDGIPYRGSLCKMGLENHTLGVLREIRNSAKKQVGDKIRVIVELDTDERTVELSEDVKKELQKHAVAAEAWDRLSFTDRKELHVWIEGAKRPETREERIRKMIARLTATKSRSR